MTSSAAKRDPVWQRGDAVVERLHYGMLPGVWLVPVRVGMSCHIARFDSYDEVWERPPKLAPEDAASLPEALRSIARKEYG